MAIAIQFGDSNDNSSVSGVIYIDAVVRYEKRMGGKTAQHPIEAGASIVDHYISNNMALRLQGVVSSVDFSPIPSLVFLENESPLNFNPPPQEVSVGGLGSGLYSLLPDVVSQFLGNSQSEVSVDTFERESRKGEIEALMEDILHGLYFNEERRKWENRMTPVTLYEMGIGSFEPETIIEDLVITQFVSTEDVESGDALFFDMTLEKIQFVTLEEAEAPNPPRGSKAERTTSEKKETSPNFDSGQVSEQPISTTGMGGTRRAGAPQEGG